MSVLSVAALSQPELAKPAHRLRRALVIAVVLGTVAAVLALYSLRPVSNSTLGSGAFAQQWRGATQSYAAETAALQQRAAGAQGGSADAVLAVYRELAESTARSVATFEAIDPPASAEQEFATFITLLKGEQRTLERVISAAQAGDAAALSVQIGNLTRSLVELVQAREAVDRLAAS